MARRFPEERRIIWCWRYLWETRIFPSGRMTSKISWNEYNMMPYDTFRWEGLDGTQILPHFIPTQGLVNTITERRSFRTTYSGYLVPNEVMGSWNRYQQKLLNTETLMPFGFGDGGDGPTQEELEYQRRMEEGIHGCPRTKLTTAGEFFRKLEADCEGSGKLPLWVGELYLEYHQDNKIEIVKKIPNLRKISITPWADINRAAEAVGRSYVISAKPNPVNLPFAKENPDMIRQEIRTLVEACRKNRTPCEILLKDISTAGYNLENLIVWNRIAKEEVER